MAITMTQAASNHVKKQLEQRGRGIGIRVGIKTSGCSGMAYVLEYVDEADDNDVYFESYGVRVYSDKKSFIYLNGTELDVVTEGVNTGLQFNNPNASSECGCGESFSVDTERG